jgi:hypothetical protein
LHLPEYLAARKTSRHDRITTRARLIYSSRLSLAAEMPGEVKIEAPSTDREASVLVARLAYCCPESDAAIVRRALPIRVANRAPVTIFPAKRAGPSGLVLV